WERLAGQLSDPPRKRGRAWRAYALAACIAGVLVLVLATLDREPPLDGEIQLVEGEREHGTGEGTGIVADPGQKEKPRDHGSTVEGRQTIVDHGTNSLTKAAREASGVLEGEWEKEAAPDALILQKVEEVVAQVEHLERVQEVSDREVDSLLRAAQQQILREKIFRPEGGVDALALLAEVEGELDASFRERVFEALKAGYLKMRTAVAQRND